MVKPLVFKGDKKAKKRKRTVAEADGDADTAGTPGGPSASGSRELTRTVGVPASADQEQEPQSDDSWVSAEATSDVVGPIVVVLPTDAGPSALACDATGKVFALPLENMVDGNPATAEPHDVRQVWVANRVAGTEQFRFKGHHGRYLGCDKSGVLSAVSEAVSPLESFTIVPAADTPGAFYLQTQRDTFLSVRPSAASSGSKSSSSAETVKGDAESTSFSSTFRIRMQARFKPRLKANKEEKAREKISRKELEEVVGRRLNEDEVRTLKRARREGDYHEQLLMVKAKGKHDKYA